MQLSEKYKSLFNAEHLMGPNGIRLLEEMLEHYPLKRGLRLLDLGCGKGLTSLYLAKETNAMVFATDLWISATDNYKRFTEWQIANQVFPLHADANDLPFANDYFDAIICIDAFHYVGTQPHFFEKKILPLLKPNGVAILAIPGLKEEIHGCEPEIILEWLAGEESEFHLFHSREWWLNHLGKSNAFDIVQHFDLQCFEAAWNDWFLSGHEYTLHDKEYFPKGVSRYLTTVGLIIKKH